MSPAESPNQAQINRRLKEAIGDNVIQLAVAQATIDALQAQLAEQVKETKDGEVASGGNQNIDNSGSGGAPDHDAHPVSGDFVSGAPV